MHILGLLSYYDESPSWLATAVAGAARFCDAIVAVDGAYALYPQAKARSHPEQAAAIVQTAEALNVGCLLYQPPTPWQGNEVEKRQAAINLAGTLAVDGDWLFIFDADYHIAECNAEVLRAELASTDLHVASYVLIEGLAPDAPDAARQAASSSSWRTRTRDVYRWNPTLRVWPAHYTYTAIIDGERQGLKGTVKDRGCLELESVSFYHRSKGRPATRQDAQQRYYRLRDMLGVETEEEAMVASQV